MCVPDFLKVRHKSAAAGSIGAADLHSKVRHDGAVVAGARLLAPPVRKTLDRRDRRIWYAADSVPLTGVSGLLGAVGVRQDWRGWS